MAPISRAAFSRRLGRLAPAALAAFVADLWAARGYETSIDGRVVTATGTDGTTRLLAANRSPFGTPLDEIDVLVAPRGLPPPERERADAADLVVLDAADLHRMALYALERSEAVELVETHLDASGPFSTLRRVAREFGGRLPARGTAAVVVLAALLTAALVAPAFVPSDLAANAGEAASGSNESRTPSSTARPLAASNCPAPPRAATAAALAPAVASTSGAGGLDGWRAAPGYNTSAIHDVENRTVGYDHVTRYITTYESPAGTVYRLLIDRWRSASTARRVAEERAATWWLWLAWGRYTFAVSAYGTDGGQLTGPAFEGTTYALLAQISKPDGPPLGDACARTLAVGPS